MLSREEISLLNHLFANSSLSKINPLTKDQNDTLSNINFDLEEDRKKVEEFLVLVEDIRESLSDKHQVAPPPSPSLLDQRQRII